MSDERRDRPTDPPASEFSRTDMRAALYLLKEFLDEQRKLREKGITLETLHEDNLAARRSNEKVVKRLLDLEEKQLEGALRLDRYGRRMRRLEERVLPSDEISPDDTGVHRLLESKNAEEFLRLKFTVEEQKKELDEAKKDKKAEEAWWKRWRWGIVAAILLQLATAWITWLAARGGRP